MGHKGRQMYHHIVAVMGVKRHSSRQRNVSWYWVTIFWRGYSESVSFAMPNQLPPSGCWFGRNPKFLPHLRIVFYAHRSLQ